MNKTILAGAIFSTILATKVLADDSATRKSLTNENEQLIAIYEEIKTEYAQDGQASTLAMHAAETLSLIPEEKDIQDFPAPLASDVNDPSSISDYYNSVADVYERQATLANGQRDNAHDAMYQHKIEQDIKTQRYNNREMPQDLTNQKGSRDSPRGALPFVSAKYTPIQIHRDADALQTRRYNELNNRLEIFELKSQFYRDLADAIECADIPAPHVSEDENSRL